MSAIHGFGFCRKGKLEVTVIAKRGKLGERGDGIFRNKVVDGAVTINWLLLASSWSRLGAITFLLENEPLQLHDGISLPYPSILATS